MDAHTLDLLRRQQLIRRLPDGREAIAVTLQYRGELPGLTRVARRSWLTDRFSAVGGTVDGMTIEPDTLSVSGQTVNAVVPIDDVEELRLRLPEELRLDVPIYRQVIDPL